MDYRIIIARDQSGRIALISPREEKHIRPGTEYIVINRLLIPKNITKAKLWDYIVENYKEQIKVQPPKEEVTTSPSLNIDSIRAMHERRLKRIRQEKLSILDGEWFKAVERKQCLRKKAIERLKEDLRNMDYSTKHINDPELVVTYWPSILDKRLSEYILHEYLKLGSCIVFLIMFTLYTIIFLKV